MRILRNEIRLPWRRPRARRAGIAVRPAAGPPRSPLSVRHAETDRWFFSARMLLGVLIAGYLTVDVVHANGIGPATMLVVLGYLLANLAVWFAGGPRFEHARWIYAALDFSFVLCTRHLFQFEALVDPNATLVGLFTLLLIAYTVYSDPVLSRVLAFATLAATGLTVGIDVVRGAALPVGMYRSYPLRTVLLVSYLGSFCLVTSLLAQRLRGQAAGTSDALPATPPESPRCEKLEELDRLKHNFIAVLSHELRTPIAPLRSSLELVRHEAMQEPERTELLGIALASAGKLQRIVEDYTRLAELLTTDRHERRRWNIRMSAFVETLCAEVKQHCVSVEGLGDLVVSADPRLLGGALLALMRRATLMNTPGASIAVHGYAENEAVILSVHDPESYVEQDILHSLGDPFLYSNERTHASLGTGIELVLAQHSIERLGGRLHIESWPGRGTTVYCHLPGRQHGVQWLDDAQIRRELQETLGV